MEELKEKGDVELTVNNNYLKAWDYYTKAIIGILELSDEQTTHYSETKSSIELSNLIKSNDCIKQCYINRSECNFKLQNFIEAIKDANRGLFL